MRACFGPGRAFSEISQSKGTGLGDLLQSETSLSSVPHSLSSHQMRILTENSALISQARTEEQKFGLRLHSFQNLVHDRSLQDLFDINPHMISSRHTIAHQALQHSVKRAEISSNSKRTFQRGAINFVKSGELTKKRKVTKQEQKTELDYVDNMLFGNMHPLMKDPRHSVLPGVNVWGCVLLFFMSSIALKVNLFSASPGLVSLSQVASPRVELPLPRILRAGSRTPVLKGDEHFYIRHPWLVQSAASLDLCIAQGKGSAASEAGNLDWRRG
jgi:hypothetical protein